MKTSEWSSLSIQHPRKPGVHTWPVFEVCLFSSSPRVEIREQLGDAMNQFVAAAGVAFKWFKTSDRSRAERIQGSPSAVIGDFLADAAFAEPGLLGLELHCGDDGDDYQPPSIELFSSALEADEDEADQGTKSAPMVWRTFLRCCVPVDERPPEGSKLSGLVSLLVGKGSWTCGHAGYSIYWNTGDSRMERELDKQGDLLRRHPALGYHDLLAFEPFIGHGLIQVGWTTLVGSDLCEQLGGPPLAADDTASDVRVVDLGRGRGVLMVAGAAPLLGSTVPPGASALDPYRLIGRRLAPVRVPDERLEFLELLGLEDEQDVRRWYLRFFDSSYVEPERPYHRSP